MPVSASDIQGDAPGSASDIQIDAPGRSGSGDAEDAAPTVPASGSTETKPDSPAKLSRKRLWTGASPKHKRKKRARGRAADDPASGTSKAYDEMSSDALRKLADRTPGMYSAKKVGKKWKNKKQKELREEFKAAEAKKTAQPQGDVPGSASNIQHDALGASNDIQGETLRRSGSDGVEEDVAPTVPASGSAETKPASSGKLSPKARDRARKSTPVAKAARLKRKENKRDKEEAEKRQWEDFAGSVSDIPADILERWIRRG